MRCIRKQLVFAHQHLLAKPTLIHPRTYAASFFFHNNDGRIVHLLEEDKKILAAPDIRADLLLSKLSKLSAPTPEAVYNISLLSHVTHRISHFMTRCVTNSLPFYSRIHHFAAGAPSACALCGDSGGDNPVHLLVNCVYRKDATLLLQSHSPQLHSDFSSQRGAFLASRQLSINELIHHCAFAKTMWKARCTAVHTDKSPDPHLIGTLYQKLLKSITIPRDTPRFTPLVSDSSIRDFGLTG